MAVKARERLESKQLSLPLMAILLFIIVGYTLLYNRVINQFDDDQIKTIIGLISLAMMVALFIFSLRYMTTNFEMTLTHDRLIIERRFFFVKKKVAEIMVDQVRAILPAEKVKKRGLNIRNFTLLNVEGKQKYFLQYQEQGKICTIKLQCSGKFYGLLKKQAKIV